MYSKKPNTVFGFHGCDEDVRDKLINNPKYFQISDKSYDWLGHGMYFWEGAPTYPTSGFREKNHIQISVLNPNCIKGYFIPRIQDNKMAMP